MRFLITGGAGFVGSHLAEELFEFANTPVLQAKSVKFRCEQIAVTPLARAIGEIGLDYHWDVAPHDEQMEALALQLQLAKKLKQLRPEMRVMLMSGYSKDWLILNYGWHFLQKPFPPHALKSKVNDVLHSEVRERLSLREVWPPAAAPTSGSSTEFRGLPARLKPCLMKSSCRSRMATSCSSGKSM